MPASAAWQGQVREALVGLGWTARQADDAVEAVTPRPPTARRSRRCSRPRCRSSADEPADRDWEDTPRSEDDGSFEATARVVDARPDERDRQVEAALRPAPAGRLPGPDPGARAASLVLEAARRRGTPPDHVLLSGPPGLGKTTLAMIVAAELEQPIRITSGPAIQHAGDLASILSSLAEGEVLFLDEIHRMSRPAEEMLYLAMEDFRVDVVVGKGPGATAIPLELPPFTVVGATTRAGLLPAPLRDRFGFTGHLDFYSTDDLVGHPAAQRPAARGRGRRGRHRRDRRRGRAGRRGSPTGCCAGSATGPRCTAGASSTCDAARAALAMFDVDERGLDRLDRAVLEALCRRFGGGPVGLTTLAVAVGEEADTVETVAEPFLVREGFLVRTPRGRAATPLAWEHLGLAPPRSAPEPRRGHLAGGSVPRTPLLPLDEPGRFGG